MEGGAGAGVGGGGGDAEEGEGEGHKRGVGRAPSRRFSAGNRGGQLVESSRRAVEAGLVPLHAAEQRFVLWKRVTSIRLLTLRLSPEG